MTAQKMTDVLHLDRRSDLIVIFDRPDVAPCPVEIHSHVQARGQLDEMLAALAIPPACPDLALWRETIGDVSVPAQDLWRRVGIWSWCRVDCGTTTRHALWLLLGSQSAGALSGGATVTRQASRCSSRMTMPPPR